MKHIFSLLLLIFTLNSSNANIEPLFELSIEQARVEIFAHYKDKSFASVIPYQITTISPFKMITGNNVIFSLDRGQTWDTLKYWERNLVLNDPVELEWPEIKCMFFMGETTLCMMHADGLFLKYDLINKTCDTTYLIPNGADRGIVWTDLFDDESVLISSTYHDSVYISYDKGINWKSFYIYPALDFEYSCRPGYPALKNKNYDFFTLFYYFQLLSTPYGYGFNSFAFVFESFNYNYEHNNNEKRIYPIIINISGRLEIPDLKYL